MARRYSRDNRGRFAGGGSGATARGGRLKTASGNKRKTQTMQSAAAPKGTIGKPRGLKPGAIKAKTVAAKTPLARSGQKIATPRLRTNAEMGRKGVVSMSARSKTVRSGDVASRKAERVSQIKERQSGITARRQINRGFTYNPDGSFNQSAANLNQRKLSRSKALQQRLSTAATGSSMANAALSRRRTAASRPARAASKPAVRKADTSASAIARRRSRANAPKSSTYLSQRLNTQSAITRSAANEIYNRQRTVAKSLGGRVDSSVARSGIGAIQGLTGSKRQRADQLRERARKRVVGGRRR